LLSFHYEEKAIPPESYPQKYHFITFVPSLTLRQLASITPGRHEITIIDDLKPKPIDYNKNYDVVGISSLTSSINHAYKVADKFRQKGSIVVMGGFHPSALPEEAKQHADSVVIGQGYESWPNLIKDISEKKLKPFYRQEKHIKIENIPPPDFTNNTWGGDIMSIKPTSGCPVKCEFCSVSNQKFKNIFETRPIKQVINEIEQIEQKYIFFCDPSLTTNTNYTKQLFKGIIGLNKKLINCYGNAHVLAEDTELLNLARKAGCIEWHVGFDSVSQDSLNGIGKKTNIVKNYKKAVKNIQNNGMSLIGEFVLGFDSDKKDIFRKTVDLINEIDINIPWLNILTPYPGTPLFEKFEKQNRLITKDWSKYTCLERNVVFHPKHMTADELLNGTKDAYKELCSPKNLLKRIFQSTNLSINSFMHSYNRNINDAILRFKRERIYKNYY